MAKKNEILLSIALEGDQEVKNKLQAVGEVGKKSLGDIEKSVGDAKAGLNKLGEPLGKVKEAISPLVEEAGLARALGGLSSFGGIFGRLASGLLSPAGLVAGVTSALLGMAKLGEEIEKTKSRLKAFGGGENALDNLNDQARKLSTSSGTLQPGLEGLLAYRKRLIAEQEQKSGISHPPGVDPGEFASSSVQILGGNAANTIPSRDTLTKAFNALFAAGRQDSSSGSSIASAVESFLSDLTGSGSVSAQSLQRLRGLLPHAADLAAQSLSQSQGRNFANAEQLAAYLQSTGKSIPSQQLFTGLAKNEGRALDAAAKSRGVSEAFEGLQGAAGRLAEKFGGDGAGLTKGIDTISHLTDKAGDALEKFQDRAKENREARVPQGLSEVLTSNKGDDLLGRIVGYIRGGETNNGAGTNPFGVITDFITKALANPGAFSSDTTAKPPTSPTSPSSPFGFLGPLQKREQELQRERDQGSASLQKAAGDHTKAASDLSQAAKDLSKAASKPPGEKKEAEKSKGDGSAAEASTDQPGARGIVEDLTTHSGSYLDTQVSGNGSPPKDVYDLNKMLRDQKAVGEYEGDKNNLTTKNIRDQLGLDTSDDGAGERLYPGGPHRYRKEADPNYQPAERGTYDENMNFVPSKHQPYPRHGDTFDTKGAGDDNPIYNFGQPQPLDFPSYTKDLRETLPPVPLPQPNPLREAPGPQSAAEVPQQFADLGTAIQDALRGLVQGITDKANGIAPTPDNKIQGPVDSLGIRGDAGGASQEITSAGTKLAAALDGVVAMIDRVQDRKAGAVAALATGGKIERFSPTHYEVIV